MSKAIIIGAGIAGIAAAIRLKALNYDVEVYEANNYPGGKLSEFESDGFRYDAGPSLFTMPDLVDELFLLMNELPSNYFKYKKLDIGCHYFYEDGPIFQAPTDIEEFAKLLQKVFNEDPEMVLKYFKKSEFIYNTTSPVFLKNSLHEWSTYFNKMGLNGIMNMGRLDLFKTMNKKNETYFKNPLTIQLFNRFATYNGSNPYKAPATLNIIPHLEFGMGVYFPEGGMFAITNALVQLASRHGVKFHYNQKVTKIRSAKHKVEGIVANGVELKADIVLSNMDVYPTYSKLLPEYKMPRQVKNVESSSSALVFYWGVKGHFQELGLHNILFSKNYEREFQAIFKLKSIDDDPTIYINISSKLNSNDAPKGCENWFVMINVPCNENQDWDALIAEARKNIIRKINKMLNIDLEALIVYESILDPRSIEQKTSSYKGALYGSSSNKKLAAFFRHPNKIVSIDNLYFCGGSVHPGGGIPLCLLSAKIATDLIAKKGKK